MQLNATADINTYLELATNAGAGVINPEVFYTKQLLDTIRYDADQYVYYRLADAMPIQEKADKLIVRRWSPLQGHTTPLEEGVPPKSDKGSVEKYEMSANQYGRYMEFTDKVDFAAVDPIVAHYTKEYSLVAMETLDLLARETLFSIANKEFAGSAVNMEALTVASKPTMTDLRLIILSLQKSLVKPRANGRYFVIGSPEFYYDMVSDPVVEKFMTIDNSTKGMYDKAAACLPPMFSMEFYETLLVPTDGKFVKNTKESLRIYKVNSTEDGYDYATIDSTTAIGGAGANATTKVLSTVSGYVKDLRTAEDGSYIPNQKIWDLAAYNTAQTTEYEEFKVQHILIVGKDALARTGLVGEDQAKMYVKAKGSSGVIDPIDQRQSIGFKINSVGFGSTRLEAVVDYVCVPSQVNLL